MRRVTLVACAALVAAPAVGHAADASLAKLPPALSQPAKIRAVYPALYARLVPGPWERLRRAAREQWMRSHPCADATLTRRYVTGHTNSWSTVLATWRCDRVPASTQSFLTCIAKVEGGVKHPDVWFSGDAPAGTQWRGWLGGKFAGTDRVVNHFQTRPYHASKVAPELVGRDRVVTYATFRVLTNPVNAARIAVRVGPGAYATLGHCS